MRTAVLLAVLGTLALAARAGAAERVATFPANVVSSADERDVRSLRRVS